MSEHLGRNWARYAAALAIFVAVLVVGSRIASSGSGYSNPAPQPAAQYAVQTQSPAAAQQPAPTKTVTVTAQPAQQGDSGEQEGPNDSDAGHEDGN